METTQPKRQVKPPDPHAPRFVKVEFDILNKRNVDFYIAIKKQYPELEQYTNSEIANCIEFFNKRIAQEVLNNRNGVRLSDGLGIIVAGAVKLSSETIANNIDFNALRQGKIIPHQNNESDQYIGKIRYSNELDNHMFDNHHMWCFNAARHLSRALAAEFKKEAGYKKYILFTSKQHIAHLFRKQKVKTAKKASQINKQIRLENHDEFAI